MSHPEVSRELLISIATGALLAAQADAEQSGKLIFRDEWKPTPRFRSSPSQPAAPTAGAHGPSHPWITIQSGSNVYRVPLPNWLDSFSDVTLTPASPAAAPVSESAYAPALAPASVSEHVSTPVSSPPHKPAGVLTPSVLEVEPQPQGFVARLLKDNDDVYNKLINHPFPQSLGNGSASLDGFRYYMIQDTKYLELCARLKMLAVARSPDFKAIEDFDLRHKSSLEYVKNSKEFLSTWLGVPESTVSATPRDKCLDASEKHYIKSTQDEDAWLAYYVVLLPCVLSYWKIAERLMDSPSTVRNAVYFPTWIENNYDRHSADKYIKFLDANIKDKGGDMKRWDPIFKMACQLEADIFSTGIQAPTPYLIVPQGTYSIQNFSIKEVVLADQKPESSGAGLPTVGLNKPGGTKEKWSVVSTKGGYTFQNVGSGLYLGIENRKEGRILQMATNPYHWWINPVRKQPLWYQIYTTENLRYTLQADLGDDLANVNPPISTRDNFYGPSQMWSFKHEQLELPSDVVDPQPVSKPVAPVPNKDVGGKAPIATPAKDTGGVPSTASDTLQNMGAQAVAVPPEGRFYAYIHNISDDNTWRYTLIFSSRDLADQWWRAVSTSSIPLLQNIRRITPQFYTHDARKWNIYSFFTDPKVATLAAPFKGKFFMALDHDRGGRGISIITPQSVVDYTSGSWFTIRSRSNPSNYWFYDESQGSIVSSSTRRTSFQVTAPSLPPGTIMIGTDDIIIRAPNEGYVNPGAISNGTGGNSLQVAAASSQVAFRFKYGDLKSGRFVAFSGSLGTSILYMPQSGAGCGWEIWQ